MNQQSTNPFNKFIRFINPGHYLCFKYLYHCIIISVSLGSLIIGINSGIFARSEIFSTIRDQYTLRDNPLPVGIDFYAPKPDSSSEYKFLYVLDRTKSTAMDNKDTAILEDMKEKILSLHRPEIQLSDRAFNKLELKEYTLQFMLYWVMKNTQKNEYYNPKFSVAIYNGTSTLDILKTNPNATAFPTWIEMNKANYIYSINNFQENLNISSPGQWTNFLYICEGIENMVHRLNSENEEEKEKTNEKVILTIISDFVHEEKNLAPNSTIRFAPIEEVEACIEKFSRDYIIYQVNLISLPFNMKAIGMVNYEGMDEASIKYRVDKKIKNLIKLFRDNFTQVYYYEFDLKNIIFKDIDQGLNYMEQMSMPVERLSKSKIVFYYPYDYMKSVRTAKADIRFNNCKELYLNFGDCINNRPEPEIFYLPSGKRPEIKNSRPISDLNNKPYKDGTLNAFCYNAENMKSYDINLEIFSPGEGVKEYCPVLFKENLSRYYSILLVVFSTILFLSMTLLFILLILNIVRLRKENAKINIFVMLFIIVGGTIFLSWFFTGNLFNWVIISISIVHNAIAIYLYSVHELDSKLSGALK